MPGYSRTASVRQFSVGGGSIGNNSDARRKGRTVVLFISHRCPDGRPARGAAGGRTRAARVKDWSAMTTRGDEYDAALERAVTHAKQWLATVGRRRVVPRATADELLPVFAGPLPSGGCEAAEVVDVLARGAEPGLMARGSGRFLRWVNGRALPAGLAPDWLVSAWDPALPRPGPADPGRPGRPGPYPARCPQPRCGGSAGG